MTTKSNQDKSDKDFCLLKSVKCSTCDYHFGLFESGSTVFLDCPNCNCHPGYEIP